MDASLAVPALVTCLPDSLIVIKSCPGFLNYPKTSNQKMMKMLLEMQMLRMLEKNETMETARITLDHSLREVDFLLHKIDLCYTFLDLEFPKKKKE